MATSSNAMESDVDMLEKAAPATAEEAERADRRERKHEEPEAKTVEEETRKEHEEPAADDELSKWELPCWPPVETKRLLAVQAILDALHGVWDRRTRHKRPERRKEQTTKSEPSADDDQVEVNAILILILIVIIFIVLIIIFNVI